MTLKGAYIPSSKGVSPLFISSPFVCQLSLPLNAIPSSYPYILHFSPKPFPLRFYKFNTGYEILFRDARTGRILMSVGVGLQTYDDFQACRIAA
jgi:hypothetical protein